MTRRKAPANRALGWWVLSGLVVVGCGSEDPGTITPWENNGGGGTTAMAPMDAGAGSSTGATGGATTQATTGSISGGASGVTTSSTTTGGGSTSTGDGAATTGDSGAGQTTGETDPGEEGCPTFDSAYDAIQKVIFENHGCTQAACHGESAVGGLDLRADVSYENLVDAPSENSNEARVQPGTATESFLYNKLRAATEPDSGVQINGSPMPVGAAPLSEDELAALQLWIQKGAPRTGSVADETKGIDASQLLDACLPPAAPVPVKPLEEPGPNEGVQFVLPEYVLSSGSEVENCTPFAYDFTDQVPAEFKDESRNVMFVGSSRVRQDAVSHHMVVWNPARDLNQADMSLEWTCRGGTSPGKTCNPQNGSRDCEGEDGVCGGPTTPGTLCGIETQGLANGDADIFELLAALLELSQYGGLPEQIANTQSPQQYQPPMEGGVYWEIPLRGVLWFNSHAFNLTEEDTTLHARMNFYYASDRQRRMVPVNVVRNDTPVGQAPFTRQEYCEDYEVPQNNSIAIMTGHTHRRGERFWVTDSSGDQIYENFVYNDPVYQRYDPWLEFPERDAAARTLTFCAMFNNGLNEDGTHDLYRVTRASQMPETTSCEPVACVAGDVGAACTSDADCGPDGGPGSCDACPITGGSTTENEMFVLMPWLILPPGQ